MTVAAPILVRLGEDRVVVKRGLAEVALGGDGVAADAEAVVELLQAGHAPDEVLNALPDVARPRAEAILRALRKRGMLEPEPAPDGTGIDAPQRAFYREFGSRGTAAIGALAGAVVTLLGGDGLARAASRDLLAAGVGKVRVVPDGETGDTALDSARLLCAISDAGEVEALYDANRVALEAGIPFLPAWIDGMVAHVGPLTYPFETACLRCYRLRADANDGARDVTAAVRRRLSEDPAARAQTGALPPMVSAAGAVLAMEALKALTELAPSDAVGRHVELNLVSFGSRVRRVLKVPRCPDCSEAMRRKRTAILTGPQIPVPARPHVA
jgi:bacteriocin biosynthesis cyclodehydratase domain-containing protein